MLQALFSSKIRVKLLTHFFSHPNATQASSARLRSGGSGPQQEAEQALAFARAFVEEIRLLISGQSRLELSDK
jgi:hypothetical protein